MALTTPEWPPLTCPACSRIVEGGPDGYACACSWRVPGERGIVRLSSDPPAGAGYPAHAAAVQAAWEKAHFWPLGRKRILGDIVSRWARAPDPGRAPRFLEVGCGTGTVLGELGRRGFDVIGCDAFLENLAFAREEADRAPLFGLDGAVIPVDAWFDAAGVFDVIEHLDDERPLLQACRRAVRPGGLLFVTVPAYQWLYGRRDRIGGHRRRYRARALEAVVTAGGWQVEWTSYFSSLLFPVFALARVLERARGERGPESAATTASELAEVRVNPIVNKLGLAAFALERTWLGLSRLPFGTSVLVVARRASA